MTQYDPWNILLLAGAMLLGALLVIALKENDVTSQSAVCAAQHCAHGEPRWLVRAHGSHGNDEYACYCVELMP